MSNMPSGRNAVALAWLAAAFVAVGAVAGLLLAYWVEGLIDPDTVGEERSLTVDLVSLVILIVAVGLPGVAAWRWGGEAEASGDGRGRAPRLMGAVFAGLVVLSVAVQLVVNAAGGRY